MRHVAKPKTAIAIGIEQLPPGDKAIVFQRRVQTAALVAALASAAAVASLRTPR